MASDHSIAALELSVEALEKASSVLEKHGEEYTRGFVRSALIELKAWIKDYIHE